jgi:hypothetical protein
MHPHSYQTACSASTLKSSAIRAERPSLLVRSVLAGLMGMMLSQPVTVFAKNGGLGVPVFGDAPDAPPPPAPRGFDMLGFIESATLDVNNEKHTCRFTPNDSRLFGGEVKVNGIRITIPCNTIVQMPATSLTWADIFYLNPADDHDDSTPPQTGLALTDTQVAPGTPRAPFNGVLPSYEIQVQGNIVDGKYIAGLVFISQQGLNAGQGVIEAIDYDTGELLVRNSWAKDAPVDENYEQVRVRINDPVGRFGKSHVAAGVAQEGAVAETDYDPRFTADVDNPTVHAATGFPMCVPRTNPFMVDGADDPLCPQANRPRSPNCQSLPDLLPGRPGFPAFVLPPEGNYCTQFVMDPPTDESATCTGPQCPTDPRRQAPFEKGDVIDYAGTLKTEIDPLTGKTRSFISAHTVVANLGIYTSPGAAPAYVGIEAMHIGTSALPIPNLPQETTSRAFVEGFTTDPTALVDIFMVDIDPETGEVSDRRIGTENPGLPPVVGRFRFAPAAGSFFPLTREFRVISRTACRTPSKTCAENLPVHANGIRAGQYRAPNFEFIFPETIDTGNPVVPNNFQDLGFLYCGSGTFGPAPFDTISTTTPVVGQLDPAPWAAPMPVPVFAGKCPQHGGPDLVLPAPVVNTGTNRVAVGGSWVSLGATATDPLAVNLTNFQWTQIDGPSVALIPGGTAASPTLRFLAPAGPAVLTFQLSVTNADGRSGVSQVNVSVDPDTVQINNANFDNRRNRGVLTVTATSSLPATTKGLKLSIQAKAGSAVLSSQPLTMTRVSNSPRTPTICPADASPCWRFSATGVLRYPAGTNFVMPSEITVTSSMGGSARITAADIQVR